MEKDYLDNISKFTGCSGNYYNAHTCIILFDSIEKYYETIKKSVPNTIFFENINKINKSYYNNCFQQAQTLKRFINICKSQLDLSENYDEIKINLINIIKLSNKNSDILLHLDLNKYYNKKDFFDIFIENYCTDKLSFDYDKNIKKPRNDIISTIIHSINIKNIKISRENENKLFINCLYLKKNTEGEKINKIYNLHHRNFNLTTNNIQKPDLINTYIIDRLNDRDFVPNYNTMIYTFIYDTYETGIQICKNQNIQLKKETLNDFIQELFTTKQIELIDNDKLNNILNFFVENNADPNLIDINQIECKRYSHNYNENIKVIATFLNDNSVKISKELFKKLLDCKIALKNPIKSDINVEDPDIKNYCYSINYNPYKLKFDSNIELLHNESDKSGNLTKIKGICKEVNPDMECLYNACKHKNNIHTVKYFVEVHKLKIDINCIIKLLDNIGNSTTRYIINGYKEDKKKEEQEKENEKKIDNNIDNKDIIQNTDNIIMDNIDIKDIKDIKDNEKPKKIVKRVVKKVKDTEQEIKEENKEFMRQLINEVTDIDDEIILTTKCQVMLRINIPDLKLANGSRGIIIGFQPITNNPLVQFLDGRILEIVPSFPFCISDI